MARRRRHEEHGNHEAWAIPYGDLVTLLMAFFVVMYAVSVVDAGKYRVLSNSLIEAFGSQVPVEPIQVGEPSLELNLLTDDVRRSLAPVEVVAGGPAAGDSHVPTLDPLSPTAISLESVLDAIGEPERAHLLNEIQEISTELEEAMGTLIASGEIKIERQPYWLELAINTSLLFSSGSATLQPSARPVLVEVAGLLGKREVRIHVEGHTDDLPISNTIYPSNWELSSGRAATVVNLFAQNGVDPKRMVAIGYGEFQPVTSNATEEGRSRNRRVAVIVLPSVPAVSGERAGPERLRTDLEAEVGRIQ